MTEELSEIANDHGNEELSNTLLKVAGGYPKKP